MFSRPIGYKSQTKNCQTYKSIFAEIIAKPTFILKYLEVSRKKKKPTKHLKYITTYLIKPNKMNYILNTSTYKLKFR